MNLTFRLIGIGCLIASGYCIESAVAAAVVLGAVGGLLIELSAL